MTARFAAVVLAGGGPDAVSALEPGAPNKAFVRIGGVELVARTIASLRSSSRVGRIVAVAPAEAAAHPALAGADDVRPSGATMTESLRSGLAAFAPDDLVLVCASDLPILTAEAIDDFLTRAHAVDADLVYACVERTTHLARYPLIPHTWATLRDGTYCGGGCVALRPRVLPALEGVLGRLGRARKNPLALAAIFGPRILVRFATRRLAIAQVEDRARELLGACARAAVCAYPEIAVNVDRASDVALANALVAAFDERQSEPARR